MRVTLNGYVVADEDVFFYRFFGIGVFSPRDIRAAIAKNPKGEDLVFEVNSGGGSVFAGFEMYSVLRAAKDVHTVAEVQSLAASAASTMMLGCDEVMLSPVAQVMIHLPSTSTDGDVNAHKDSIRILNSITVSILNAYELRCKGKSSRDQLESMMNKATWFPAQDALDAGLADGVLYQDGETPLVLPKDITNAVGGGIRALANSAGDIPAAETLRAKYQKLVDEGKAKPVNDAGDPVETGVEPPAPEGAPTPTALRDDWRSSARVALAKINQTF